MLNEAYGKADMRNTSGIQPNTRKKIRVKGFEKATVMGQEMESK